MNEIRKGVEFRIYPNKKQRDFINQTLGCCRLIYNIGLNAKEDAYHNGQRLSFKQTSSMLTQLKHSEEYSFLKEVDSVALQQSLRDLDSAYNNFFAKRSNLPKYKSKKDHSQTYRTLNKKKTHIHFVGKYLKLPKMGYVKVKQTMEVGKIHFVTIKKTSTNKYYAILNVEFEPKFKQSNGKQIGIDVGLKDFYTDSYGNKIKNPKFLEKQEKKIRREQRRLFKKQKGSSNREKQRIKLARIHEKITNQRNDFLQKESTRLVRENQTICIEDLNIEGMLDKMKLGKAITSASWLSFYHMLEYKATWYGNEIIKVPMKYPSSQICSRCGNKNSKVRNLAVRKWECPICHVIHDRDVNASINILKKGLSIA